MLQQSFNGCLARSCSHCFTTTQSPGSKLWTGPSRVNGYSWRAAEGEEDKKQDRDCTNGENNASSYATSPLWASGPETKGQEWPSTCSKGDSFNFPLVVMISTVRAKGRIYGHLRLVSWQIFARSTLRHRMPSQNGFGIGYLKCYLMNLPIIL